MAGQLIWRCTRVIANKKFSRNAHPTSFGGRMTSKREELWYENAHGQRAHAAREASKSNILTVTHSGFFHTFHSLESEIHNLCFRLQSLKRTGFPFMQQLDELDIHRHYPTHSFENRRKSPQDRNKNQEHPAEERQKKKTKQNKTQKPKFVLPNSLIKQFHIG